MVGAQVFENKKIRLILPSFKDHLPAITSVTLQNFNCKTEEQEIPIFNVVP